MGLTRLVYSKLPESYTHVEKNVFTLSVFTDAVLRSLLKLLEMISQD